MPETKVKKPAVKRASKKSIAPITAAANSPIPCGTCGSSSCDGTCEKPVSVRYCGPTSHPSHHHVHVAAQGTKHTWAAAVVAGLAVVVTLSVAYSAVQASSETRSSIRETVDQVQVLREMGRIRAQLTDLQQKVDGLTEPEATAEEMPSVPVQNAP